MEKHRKVRPIAEQMFSALFSKLAVVYTETILYTLRTNRAVTLRFTQDSMGNIGAGTGARAVSEW